MVREYEYLEQKMKHINLSKSDIDNYNPWFSKIPMT